MPYKDYAKHKENSLARYHVNPERGKAQAISWRKENPEAWAVIQARSQKKTRRKRAVRAKESYAALDPVAKQQKLSYVRQWRIDNVDKYILSRLRRRAAVAGVPFDLVAADIVVPERCPVLGIPIRIDGVGQRDDSPSVDRLKPALGYVRGNVRVISMKANRIKNDATVEELQLVLQDLRRIHGHCC